ncbi:Disease resistance protein RPP4 [Spatholobus suberectus]|nr:Disease resistance protein RPP4 [Spatholobus suberectus]
MFYSGMAGNNHGMTITKSTFDQKKVFIIFEGINYPNLLKVVVELTNWFGSGSRVIITSQDKYLLESHGVERVYQVERSDRTTVRYDNVIDRAQTCTSSDTFALEVIDYNSPGKTIEECNSALDQCERIPNTDVMMQNMVRENNRIGLSKDILEENKEDGMLDAQPAPDDRSRIWDPMELEYQLCSSSSSLDAL